MSTNEDDLSAAYVDNFLKPAVREIDSVFGKQYAMTHDAALAGYLIAIGLNSLAHGLREIATAIGQSQRNQEKDDERSENC